MPENVVINFEASLEGFEPLIKALKEMGTLTEKQATEFLNLEKKQQEQLSKTTEQVKAQNSELGKLVNNLKNAGEGVAGGALKQSFTGLEGAMKRMAAIPIVKQLQELKKAGKENTDEFKKLAAQLLAADKAFNSTAASVEQVEVKTKKLTTQLRDMKNQLALLDESSPEFEKLAIAAAKLEDQISDTNARIRVLASDTFKFDAFIGTLQGISAGFAVAQGAAALFGEENEDVQRAILKVTAAISILNGLQQLQNTLQKESAARLGITVAAKKVYTFVTNGATVAARAFNAALVATGIGAVVVGIGLLVAYWEDIAKFIGIAKDEQKEFLNDFDEFLAKNNAAVDRIKSNASLAQLSTRTLNDEISRLKDQLEDIPRDGLEITLPNGQTVKSDMTAARKEITDQIKLIEKELEKRKPPLKVEVQGKPELIELKNTLDGIQSKEIEIVANIKTGLEGENTIDGFLEKKLKAEQDAENAKQAEIRSAAIESAQLLNNTLFEIGAQRRQAELNDELSKLEKQKQIELDAAGDNATARAAIEAKYRKKEAEVKRKSFQQEKNAAIIQATINTAIAFVKALPNFLLAGLAAAAGAAQIAVIASQPVPQFKKGTKSSPEGYALVGEQGPELVHLPKGAKVVTHPETRNFLNGVNVADIIAKYNLPQVAQLKPTGTDSYSGFSMDYERLGSEIAKHRSITQVNIDENGFETRIQNGLQERVYLNKRHSF